MINKFKKMPLSRSILANNPNYVFNPLTKRFVCKTSKTYDRLVKSGHVIEDDAVHTPSRTTIQQPENDESEPEPPIKEMLADELTDIVRDNQDKLMDLTEKQTNKLLRKLLYEKLTVSKEKKKKNKQEKPKKKPKKYKIKTPPPSDSETSESESESESESD